MVATEVEIVVFVVLVFYAVILNASFELTETGAKR